VILAKTIGVSINGIETLVEIESFIKSPKASVEAVGKYCERDALIQWLICFRHNLNGPSWQ
jgi:hypothetical protein